MAKHENKNTRHRSSFSFWVSLSNQLAMGFVSNLQASRRHTDPSPKLSAHPSEQRDTLRRASAHGWRMAGGAWLGQVSYTKRLVPDISPGIDDCPSLAAKISPYDSCCRIFLTCSAPINLAKRRPFLPT